MIAMSKTITVTGLVSLLWLSAVFAGAPRCCGTCCEKRAELPSIIPVHFSMRAQTAGWSLAFACNDAHCTVRKLHRPRKGPSLDRFFVITVSDGAL